jgi:Glycosyl transferase family 11
MSPETEHPLVQTPPSRVVPAGSQDGKLIVVGLRCGRLANRLALFANLIAFAEEHGHRLINFTFHSYAGLFEATRRDVFCRYPAATGPSWLDVIPGVGGAIRKTRILYHAVRGLSVLNQKLPVFGNKVVTLREGPGHQLVILLETSEIQARIADARVVFVYGFIFRAPAAMQKHAEKIRAYFRPIEKHERASRQAVDRLRQHADVVVGVHIRRGDYIGWARGKYFFPVSRYAAWMHELAGQFPGRKVSFLVCSNEPRTAREFPGLSVGFAAGSPVEDLYALAGCDYVMGPVSSFTQWASFYGGKPLLHLRDSKDPIERDKFRVCYLEEVPH